MPLDYRGKDKRQAINPVAVLITAKQFEVYDGYKYLPRRCIVYEL
jgi:hypothetical protein